MLTDIKVYFGQNLCVPVGTRVDESTMILDRDGGTTGVLGRSFEVVGPGPDGMLEIISRGESDVVIGRKEGCCCLIPAVEVVMRDGGPSMIVCRK